MATLNQIADREWEILIIGGGIYGAAIARDAVLRGFKVALVERNDFASETSSRSTKLIHGGIRYLEQLQFGLVRECLSERSILLNLAPHLVRPLPFLFPVFKGDRFPLPVVKMGTKLYSLLANRDTLHQQESLSKSELKNRFPFLENSSVKGAIRYFDAQMDDTRLCLETILSAEAEGARVVNHAEVTQLGIRSDGKFNVKLQDTLSDTRGELRARSIVNAAGPWANRILSKLLPQHKPILKLSKGIHLLIDKKISDDAIILSSSDKRIIFIIPWKNGSLVGTTDTPFNENLDQVRANEFEIDFLLHEVERKTGGLKIKRNNIITTFAGVRPLAALGGKNTARISRKHIIHEMPKRFFSVVGGKYTTHRLIAEQVCDQLEISFGRKPVPCKTKDIPLIGSFDLPTEPPRFYIATQNSEMSKPSLTNILKTYGGRMRGVLAIANCSTAFQRPFCIHHDLVGAQVLFAIEHELAHTLMDVCVRRLRLDQMPCRGSDCIEKVADFMADRLRWGWLKREKEVLQYQNWVRQNTEFL